jgi:signal peptidase I
MYKSVADFIIPTVIKQLAFGYLCYYGGMKPLIIYRIIIILYTYVIPIHPNFDLSIVCMLNILLPSLIYIKSKEFIYEEKREKELIVKKKFNLEYVMVSCICLFLVMLVSGVLPIGITAIGSNSMYPTFSKGSGVLTIKVNKDEIKKGDIITFTKDNRKVIHRVAAIENDNGVIHYITKGDANTSVDEGYIKYEDIQNKIILSIPLIGYPSVIFEVIFS